MTNTGAVAAVDVVTRVVFHNHDETAGDWRTSAGGAGQWTTAELLPFAELASDFGLVEVTGSPPEAFGPNDVLEFLVACRAPADRRRFAWRAFYFYDPDLGWVTETQARDSPLSPLVATVTARSPAFGSGYLIHSDFLHPVDLRQNEE